MVSDTEAAPANWTAILARLHADPHAIPWRRREALLTDHAEDFTRPTPEMLLILELLARDSRWEVRRRVAELLCQLPEEIYPRLAARLSEDSNLYVRRTAERSLDRRQGGHGSHGQRRRASGGIAEDQELLERLHGPLATKVSRQVAERLYDLLVGATIHDMRGLLTPISASAQRLLGRASEGGATPTELRKHLERIVAATEDLRHLLDDVRRFSRQVPVERRQERLRGLILEAIENARAGFARGGHHPDRILVRMEVSDLLTVEASRAHLLSALTNLIQNAFDGFRPKLDLEKSLWIDVHGRVTDSNDVELIIEDNAIGFGAEDLRRVRQFIPGRTTLKRDGTGFGLPTAKRYIEAHGGTLEIDSQEGVGTRVRLRLPLADD